MLNKSFTLRVYALVNDRTYVPVLMLLLFNLYRSDDDVDSEVEEALYSQVHYASSLLISENSTPGINVLHLMLPLRMTTACCIYYSHLIIIIIIILITKG